MIERKIRYIIMTLAVVLSFSGSAFCITAKELYADLMANPNLARTKGEIFTWHARAGIDDFIMGYYAYDKDRSWLEEAGKYYDFLISKMEKEPDGFMGWVGPEIGIEGVEGDGSLVIGDANLIDPMLAFSEIVMKDASLKASFLGKKSEGYMALARSTLIDKWDKRKGYYEDGMFAAYLNTATFTDKKTKQFRTVSSKVISENLNKHARIAACFLKLYRITGETMYKERAEKIFSRYKAIMRYHKDEDRYFWNFWEPLGPFDFKGAKPSSWVAVHPNRGGYQSSECAHFVEAYHTGVVFSEEDIKKFINTNLWMWNKSLTGIHFTSSDGTQKSQEKERPGDAGALWSSLADFSPKIREIYAVKLKEDESEIEKDYFKNVTCKEPPSFKRKYVTGEVKLPDIPVYPSRDISMAVCIPSHVSTGKKEEMKIACQVKAKGTVKLSLLGEDGKTLISEIGSLDAKRADDIFNMKWDGKDSSGKALIGKYRVRFTMNDSTREWPINLTE